MKNKSSPIENINSPMKIKILWQFPSENLKIAATVIHDSLNSPNYSMRARLRLTNFTVPELTVMSWIFFIIIFFTSSSEIFSAFNIHHPVYGCLIHLLYIVNHRFGLSSTSSWQTPSYGEKSKLILKKKYLKTDIHSLLTWWLLYVEQIVILKF